MFQFTKRWLQVFILLFIILGLFIGIFHRSGLYDTLFDNVIAQSFWSSGIRTAQAEREVGFLMGLSGSLMAVFGILMYYILHYGVFQRKKWARNALILAIAVWFLQDEGWSIYYQVWFNVWFNLGFLILWVTPLLLSWKEFTE